MKKHILLLALLLTVFAGKSATYYWVSGTGNWSDLTHWATSSGGNTFYASVPGNSDDVVFDANSFSSTNQSVTINVSANMKSLSFTGIPTGTSIYGSITVYGSVTLHSNLSSGLYIALKGTGTHTFTSAGQTIGNIIQSGSGSYTLQDPLKVSSSIDIQDGSFYANGYNIDCGTFGSTTKNTRTIDISNITITLRSGWGATSLFYLQNLTLNSSGCQFEVLDSHVLYFYGNYPISIKGAHFYYATATANGLVQFRAENCTATGSIILDGLGTVICTKGTLHLVEFKKSCSFWVQKVTVDSLLFSGTGGGYAMDLGIGSNDTLTISSAWISQPGLCANANTYTQNGGKIRKTSGSVTLDYVKMYSMKAIGGATFTANNVLYDNGANSGWTINTLPPTKYYWVGGTGNWSDPTHWAFTSGGAGQASSGCIPTRYDSVYFDANSFSAGGQTVTVDVTAECANMDWRGVTNTPTFYKPNNCASVFVYGSLFFDANMVFNMTFNY